MKTSAQKCERKTSTETGRKHTYTMYIHLWKFAFFAYSDSSSQADFAQKKQAKKDDFGERIGNVK